MRETLAGSSALSVVLVVGFLLSGGPVISLANPGSDALSRQVPAVVPRSAESLHASVLPDYETQLADSPGVSPSDASPVLGPGWDALSLTSTGLTPPDVQLAVGPNHVVEAVNLALGVYSKNGTSVGGSNLSTLFSTGADFLSDPRILYDSPTDRWFVSVADFSTGQVLVGASKTPDPMGAWSSYRVPSAATANCPDQPILGVGTLNVIVSVNLYSDCFSPTYTYYGARFWVLNKTDLTAGVANPSTFASLLYPAEFSIHPARMEGPSPVQYLVATFWDANADVAVRLHSFAVSGSPPEPVQVSMTDLQMATAQIPPPVAQHGSFYLLDSGDFRVADAVWARDTLWLAFDDSCRTVFSWTACVRLIDLDTNTSTIREDFWVSSALQDYFYPALALDGRGNLAIIVGFSSNIDYPGLRVTGRLSDDTSGEFQPTVLAKAGSGPDESWCSSAANRCRYGDYFGASPDPSDPTQVWLAGQYGRGTFTGWGTYIVPVRIKAMLTVNYSVDSGPAPSEGPTLHFVLNGTSVTGKIATSHATFLADPGTPWQIDSSFTTASGNARYVSRADDEAKLHGVANRSVVHSLAYQIQYPLSIDVTSGGSVAYEFSGTAGAVGAGTKTRFFAFPGSVVNLTARPSSLLYVFAGWTGDLAGDAPSGSVTVAEPRSVVARFALNWAMIAAISTVAAIAVVASVVYLRRRRRNAKPLPPTPIPPATPPPTGPPPDSPPP